LFIFQFCSLFACSGNWVGGLIAKPELNPFNALSLSDFQPFSKILIKDETSSTQSGRGRRTRSSTGEAGHDAITESNYEDGIVARVAWRPSRDSEFDLRRQAQVRCPFDGRPSPLDYEWLVRIWVPFQQPFSKQRFHFSDVLGGYHAAAG